MRILSSARRYARVLKPPAILLYSQHQLLSSHVLSHASLQCKPSNNASSGTCLMPQHPIYSMMSRKSFSTEAGTITGNPTEVVKELHDKMLEFVNVK